MIKHLLISLLSVNVAYAENYVASQSSSTSINEVKIYEASYRDLLTVAYDNLRKSANEESITALLPPNIGYEWSIGGVKCTYRFIPTKGIETHNRVVVGYFFEFMVEGKLPLLSIFNIEKAVEEVLSQCSEVDEAIIHQLYEHYLSISVKNYSAIGDHEGIGWRSKEHIEMIEQLTGYNQPIKPTR